MSDTFGRQPKPVKVILEGEQQDINNYIGRLRRAAESSGDNTNITTPQSFTIYPRAVND